MSPAKEKTGGLLSRAMWFRDREILAKKVSFQLGADTRYTWGDEGVSGMFGCKLREFWKYSDEESY